MTNELQDARTDQDDQSDSADDNSVAQGSARQPRKPRRYELQIPSPQDAPSVSIALATSGIHPASSRMVAFSAVFFDEDGEIVEVVSAKDGPIGAIAKSLNTGEDAGPRHLHGFSDPTLAGSQGFSSLMGVLFSALHQRTVILDNLGQDWGFLANEFKMAQRTHKRQSRNRNRRALSPKPVELVDVQGTAYAQKLPGADTRLRTLAQRYPDALVEGTLPEVTATASAERADIDPLELLTADAELIYRIYEQQLQEDADAVVSYAPSELSADRFALQRPKVRVEAARAPIEYENPGIWDPEQPFVQGLEFVIAPDVQLSPSELIEKAQEKGLLYSEKLNRTTSLVVNNGNQELWGKAMHADRKNIPIVTDEEFLSLLDDVQPGKPSSDISSRARRANTKPITRKHVAKKVPKNAKSKRGQRNPKGYRAKPARSSNSGEAQAKKASQTAGTSGTRPRRRRRRTHSAQQSTNSTAQ